MGRVMKNVFDISENSTVGKPCYFSLSKTTRPQSTIFNYAAAKHICSSKTPLLIVK